MAFNAAVAHFFSIFDGVGVVRRVLMETKQYVLVE